MSAPTLRQRKPSTRATTTTEFGMGTVESPLKYRSNTGTSSQLPSPVSSIDEGPEIEELRAMSDEDESIVVESARAEPMAPKRRASMASRRRMSSTDSSASDRMDIPLAVAMIPPLGTFLTGGDFLKDFLLLLLLFFYLHQLIKLPWDLYRASRPRGLRVDNPNVPPERKLLQDLAESELKRAELAYLALSVLAPLLGAALLRYVGTALTGKDYISWFSTGVFVLVTGVRPWRHLSQRLHDRTEELHESIAAFQTKGPDLSTRVVDLEKEVESLKKELASKRDMSRFRHDVNGALDDLDSALGRHEHAIEDQYHGVDQRVLALERTVTELLKGAQGRPHMWMLSSPGTLFNRLNGSTPAGVKKTANGGRRPSRLQIDTDVKGQRRKSGSEPKMPSGSKHRPGLFGNILDFLLYPFSVGRTLLWGIVDFLQRHLV